VDSFWKFQVSVAKPDVEELPEINHDDTNQHPHRNDIYCSAQEVVRQKKKSWIQQCGLLDQFSLSSLSLMIDRWGSGCGLDLSHDSGQRLSEHQSQQTHLVVSIKANLSSGLPI